MPAEIRYIIALVSPSSWRAMLAVDGRFLSAPQSQWDAKKRFSREIFRGNKMFRYIFCKQCSISTDEEAEKSFSICERCADSGLFFSISVHHRKIMIDGIEKTYPRELCVPAVLERTATLMRDLAKDEKKFTKINDRDGLIDHISADAGADFSEKYYLFLEKIYETGLGISTSDYYFSMKRDGITLSRQDDNIRFGVSPSFFVLNRIRGKLVAHCVTRYSMGKWKSPAVLD